MNCKNCGAELFENNAVDGVVECEYCFSRYPVPKKGLSPAAYEFLRIGEHELDVGRFDEAYSAYEKAAGLDPEEPEAQFGMALARFKVQYLRDEVNNRLQAICNEITDKKFQDDSRYLSALSYATEAQREEYRKRAEEIDYIRSEFYDLKNSGIDFDCFLCVKVTGADGEKTEDSRDADYIYDLLKDAGFKPFYSERNIRNRTGADYEAMILYALRAADTMLVICREEEYLQTPWVKNEYTRFLRLVNDEEKESDALSIVYYEKPIERLSGKRGKIQGIDFSRRDADRKICEFVKNHTEEARALKQKEEEEKKRREDKLLRELEEQKRARQELEARINALRSDNKSAALQYELNRQIDLLTGQKEKQAYEEKRKESERRNYERENNPTIDNYDSYKFEIKNKILIKYKGAAKDVKIPRGVVVIGKEAFAENSFVTNVTIPNSVTAIEERAFFYCKSLTDITIPDSVTEIGVAAFSRCPSIKNIAIPDSVSSIARNAFNGEESGLEEITVGKNNRFYSSENGVLYNKTKTHLIRVPQKFQGDFTVPDSVGTIGDFAFSDCKSVRSVTIPDTVSSIGEYAFYRCSVLSNVTILNNITEIKKSTFAWCPSLNKIKIPDSVVSIGENAFYMCSGLTEIMIPDAVTSIGRSAFSYCSSLTDVTIGTGVTSIGKLAFMDCNSVKRVTMPKRLKKVRYSVGSGKTKFTFTK